MKVVFYGECMTPVERLDDNAKHARGLGLPKPSRPTLLAVVGGGPSIREKADVLRTWPGDIWIVSSAFPWCLQNGIRGTYFNIDPVPECAPEAVGATRAIVASLCDPAVFDVLKHARVEMFDLTYPQHWVSTATAAPHLALSIGYSEIVFFGCESSFAETTHAYRDEYRKDVMAVKCGEDQYRTTPDYFMQAEYLSGLIKICPAVFKEQSGGLLTAMTRHAVLKEKSDGMLEEITHDFDIVAASRPLKERFTKGERSWHEAEKH